MTTTTDTTNRTGGDARWNSLRTLLEEQRADAARERAAALEECAQSVPDPVAQRRSADLLVTVEQIDAALARIDAGTYGRCTGCGNEIPEERLELRPFAETWIACTDPR